MSKRLILVFTLAFCCVGFVKGETPDSTKKESSGDFQIHNGYIYKRPKILGFAASIPKNVWNYNKSVFRKEQIPNIIMMTIGTAALVAVDQPLLDGAKKLGDNLGLSHENRQNPLFQAKIPIAGNKLLIQFNVPFDATTTMYYIGDGVTHFSIAGAFWLTGLIRHDYRALQTSSQLMESILSAGFMVQLLKHITGRQSPFTSTAPGGLWRPFPNQVEYAKNVPHYDAFPSGHLATTMATITVIASNYEEYKFIRPVGYTLMGLLSYAMMNNGVHWISDYPLGLAFGYAFAKMAVNKGRVLVAQGSAESYRLYNRIAAKTTFRPGLLFTGDPCMTIAVKF